MKKYISAVLISCLLLEFGGCYSQREITYEEFYTLPKGQEAELNTKDGKTIKLTSDSLKNNYMYWWKSSDTLTIYSTHLEKVWSTALMEVTDTIQYPKEDISKIVITEFDKSRTILGIAGTAILVGLIIYGISTMEFEMEGW
ncbi:MAG: hypothetical protein IPM14_04595 [bacterium]|nr:hypothetical protein [bacterium]